MRKKVLAITLSGLTALSMTTAFAAEDATEAGGKAAYKVGIVKYVDDASLNQIMTSVEGQLDILGEQENCTFNYKDYEFDGQADASSLNQIGAELVSDDVDAIVAIATPTAQIMQSVTEDTDIPIIFSAVTDPEGAKLVESLDAPGSKITGTSDALDTGTVMNLILAANPDTDYVGLLYSKSEDASTKAIEDAKAFLEDKGIRYIEKTGTTTDEISAAVDALVAEGVDAVFTPTDNTVMTAELSIYEKFTDAGIPQYCGADSFALNGAFLGYGVNYESLGVETANMVKQVLADGKDPATLPVVTLDSGIATINTETAEALGMDADTVEKAFQDYNADISIVETTTKENFD